MSTAPISTSALIAKFQQALSEGWGYIWGTAGETWTAAKQKELEKTTDPDREKGREYGSKWIGKKVADCSGLFSWAFRQLGGYMYHGSNTMWNKYCTAKGSLKSGKRTDGAELEPGTAVFTYNAKKNNRGHVGLYIGNGWVIEAQGTKAGVVRSKVTNSKWVEWGELKGVDYGNAQPVPQPVTPSADPVTPTLKKGSKGDYVQLLQTKLIMLGYDLGSYGADGDFGSKTTEAVKAFQKDRGLEVDGIVGKKTWEALEQPAKAATYTVTIRNLPLSKAEEITKTYGGQYTAES